MMCTLSPDTLLAAHQAWGAPGRPLTLAKGSYLPHFHARRDVRLEPAPEPQSTYPDKIKAQTGSYDMFQELGHSTGHPEGLGAATGTPYP